MSDIQFDYQVFIHERHLDFLGHVNNAMYLELFEEARWDFLTKNGYGIEQFHEHQMGPVVLEVNIKYKREIRNRESIVIRSRPIENKGKIMRMQQQMISPKGDICSEAIFTFGFMDFTKRKLVSPPASWLKAIGFGEL